ncbi:hypothetical protein Trydic_g9139 [Trypoxylus dichotomus]
MRAHAQLIISFFGGKHHLFMLFYTYNIFLDRAITRMVYPNPSANFFQFNWQHMKLTNTELSSIDTCYL